MSINSVSEALRLIGRDFDLRGLKTFAIKLEDEHFLVEAGYQPPPAVTPVTVHYCLKDIEELNRKFMESSDFLSATRSFIYLSEILAAVGAYVEDKDGCLLNMSNTASGVAARIIDISYRTPHAGEIHERLTDNDVYALCIREHKRNQRRQAWSASRLVRFSSLSEPDVTIGK